MKVNRGLATILAGLTLAGSVGCAKRDMKPQDGVLDYARLNNSMQEYFNPHRDDDKKSLKLEQRDQLAIDLTQKIIESDFVPGFDDSRYSPKYNTEKENESIAAQMAQRNTDYMPAIVTRYFEECEEQGINRNKALATTREIFSNTFWASIAYNNFINNDGGASKKTIDNVGSTGGRNGYSGPATN